jgi:hypothetical protein
LNLSVSNLRLRNSSIKQRTYSKQDSLTEELSFKGARRP